MTLYRQIKKIDVRKLKYKYNRINDYNLIKLMVRMITMIMSIIMAMVMMIVMIMIIVRILIC